MSYDVIIVGAGSMGMAAGYYLTKENKKVLLLDSYDPPHSNGSHHGETRIIRHAYGEGAKYVPLVLRAQELWEELEKEAGMELFIKTGVLNIGEESSPFIQEVQNSAKEYGLSVETLSAQEINNKWEGLNLPSNLIGCYETNSGVLFSEKSILAFRQLAEANGATIKVNSRVVDMDLRSDKVIIKTEDESYEAASLIIATGAQTGHFLKKLNKNVPLQRLRKTFSWFQAPEAHYDSTKFPAFTMNIGDEMYYGFPSIHKAGLKIGRHDGGQPLQPDEAMKPFGAYVEDEEDVTKVIRQFFPKVGELKEGKTCMYTNTPDEDFIIDYLPKLPNVVLACGFSGHGFKFSSVVGEIVSKLVTNNNVSFDLSPFQINRF